LVIIVLNYGANDGILDFAVVQVDADLVADLELSIVWLLWDWHARNVPFTRHIPEIATFDCRTFGTRTDE